jgi:hypothetical protein
MSPICSKWYLGSGCKCRCYKYNYKWFKNGNAWRSKCWSRFF